MSLWLVSDANILTTRASLYVCFFENQWTLSVCISPRKGRIIGWIILGACICLNGCIRGNLRREEVGYLIIVQILSHCVFKTADETKSSWEWHVPFNCSFPFQKRLASVLFYLLWKSQQAPVWLMDLKKYKTKCYSSGIIFMYSARSQLKGKKLARSPLWRG